jgi:hypothetical protein
LGQQYFFFLSQSFFFNHINFIIERERELQRRKDDVVKEFERRQKTMADELDERFKSRLAEIDIQRGDLQQKFDGILFFVQRKFLDFFKYS